MSEFQMWKDYFQLAKRVEAMVRRDEDTGLSPSGEKSSQNKERSSEGLVILEQTLPLEEESLQLDLLCSFCKHNGESRNVYASHKLKDEAGRVQCPYLRKYTCPQCGASKDTAHTRRFCPLTKEGYASVYRGCARNSAGKKKLRKASDGHGEISPFL